MFILFSVLVFYDTGISLNPSLQVLKRTKFSFGFTLSFIKPTPNIAPELKKLGEIK